MRSSTTDTVSSAAGNNVRVFSRRGNEHTDRAPAIAEALLALEVKSVTLDGEGVVCGPDGVTDFNRLRAALGRKGSRQAFLYAFDVLELDGNDMRRELWDTRRTILIKLLRNCHDGIRLSEYMDGTDGYTVFEHACKLGLEGIVAKRRYSRYQSGRSPDWIKVKQLPANKFKYLRCRGLTRLWRQRAFLKSVETRIPQSHHVVRSRTRHAAKQESNTTRRSLRQPLARADACKNRLIASPTLRSLPASRSARPARRAGGSSLARYIECANRRVKPSVCYLLHLLRP
jgi:hypothetical protein